MEPHSSLLMSHIHEGKLGSFLCCTLSLVNLGPVVQKESDQIWGIGLDQIFKMGRSKKILKSDYIT